jgi:hypothetical protein
MRDTQANNKNLVEVHDYLDAQIPLLERMHHKRRRILARRDFTLAPPPSHGHTDAGQPAVSPAEAPLPTASSPGPTTAQVRAWANDQGIDVPARGRLRAEIWDAYRATHP